jgi:predicted DNA-binding transcriptional regulator AlpA
MSKYMMNKTDSQSAIKSPFITLPEAVKATHCPRSTILKYTKLGLFPPMIRLLGNRIAFNRADVEAWIESRLDVSNQQTN